MTTEADAIAALARAGAKDAHIVKSQDGREYLITPDGFDHEDITPPNKIEHHTPNHIRQHVALQTVDSLVEYIERFKGDETMLFANIDKDSIAAQMDYHLRDSDFGANYIAHCATLTLKRSIEWNEWTKISDTLMEQLPFARFIEENAADIAAPAGAELLECIRDLQAHRKVNFTKAVRTSSDNENFEYSDQTEARTKNGGIEIPTKFKLMIPVYFGEPDTELFAFLRWRLDEGSLKLGIKLHRAEHVRQAVFKQIVTAVAERTQVPAVFGSI